MQDPTRAAGHVSYDKNMNLAAVIEERLHLCRSACRKGLDWAASERTAEPGCRSHAAGTCAGTCV